MSNCFNLPPLPYQINALEPYISQEQLTIHHDIHHAKYVENANKGLERLEKNREEKSQNDLKAIAKELSFNTGGHILHSLFWTNLAPSGQSKNEPDGLAREMIEKEFGSFSRFKEEFSKIASTTEGSGWAVLSYFPEEGKAVIMQIEKHNVNICPEIPIILVLDVWEHAYYLDYQNRRDDFIQAFWNIVAWDVVSNRLKNIG